VALRLDVEHRTPFVEPHRFEARAPALRGGRVTVEAVVRERLDEDDDGARRVVRAVLRGDDETALHVVLVREHGALREARRVVLAAAPDALLDDLTEDGAAHAAALVVLRVEDGVVDEEVRLGLAHRVVDEGAQAVRLVLGVRPVVVAAPVAVEVEPRDEVAAPAVAD
jgi:hypothetical protein